jgi:signal transduction histidine kinase
VDFVVLAPVWQRWWFLAILAVLGAVAAYALHRWRLARVVELERVRTRIATDLHDDIGSGLSQIAILTEVVRRKGEAGARAVPEALSEIAGTARELVDSMSDIVWAIDPEHDRIGDLTHRMRRFAEDLCGAAGIALTFRAPDSGKSVVVGALVRRQVYLVLKESLNNAVRHSGCNEALVEFRLEGGDLRLTVADNGRGFDPDAASANGGHGVKSIRERARRLGGSVEWKSLPGGTAVELRAPLGRRGGRVSGPHEHAMRRAGAGR